MKEIDDGEAAVGRDLQEELMDELRAVKVQQLLAGEQSGNHSSDSGCDSNPADDELPVCLQRCPLLGEITCAASTDTR